MCPPFPEKTGLLMNIWKDLNPKTLSIIASASVPAQPITSSGIQTIIPESYIFSKEVSSARIPYVFSLEKSIAGYILGSMQKRRRGRSTNAWKKSLIAICYVSWI